jgi:GntR family transcriptional repressor for pyruvate dehydrogenase complex
MVVTELEPVSQRRETTSSEVARRLVAFLLGGSLKPGDRLPSERQLSSRLGVGRSVVREALKSLTLLGLVEVRLGDGTYLKRADSDLLPQVIEWGLLLGAKRTLDLVETRRYLEVVVAGLAAERCEAADAIRLGERLEAMRVATGDPERFVAADIDFHVLLAAMARNESLEQIMSSVHSLLTVWISRVMHQAHSYEPTLAEHAAVFEAVRTGDAEAARAAMERHMLGATQRLRATLVRDDERGAPGASGSEGMHDVR